MASNGTQPSETAEPRQVADAGQPDGTQSVATDTVAQSANGQITVALTKTGRLAVPVPASPEAVSVQSAAMASPTMAPLVAFQMAPAATQTASAAATLTTTQSLPVNGQQTSTILASAQPAATTIGKGHRIVSPAVAPAVDAGQIQPAAAQAIALDEAELTPDMVALQSVVPTPRPETSTLAYAAQPRAVAAVTALDSRLEFPPAPGDPLPETASGAPADLSKLIKRYAGLYGVPESLVHRVVHRESKYDPKAYHKNGYWGLMQIKYSTAKSMGYDGPAEGLLDAETNLKYAIKYLRGAWLVADNKNDNAIKLYARGYYYDAKRKDMLHVLQK